LANTFLLGTISELVLSAEGSEVVRTDLGQAFWSTDLHQAFEPLGSMLAELAGYQPFSSRQQTIWITSRLGNRRGGLPMAGDFNKHQLKRLERRGMQWEETTLKRALDRRLGGKGYLSVEHLGAPQTVAATTLSKLM
jgi:hypothetical protein